MVSKKEQKSAAMDNSAGKEPQVGYVDGGRLRKLRERRHLSRRELAYETGVSLPTISRLELGHAPTGTDTLMRIARFLGVPCGYLLGEEAPSLDKYGLGQDLEKALIAFLDNLMGVQGNEGDKCRMLEAVGIFLSSQAGVLASKTGISEEEEVLGLWWSIVNGYQHGEWELIRARSEALIQLAKNLGRPFLMAIAYAYRAKALRNIDDKAAVEDAEMELKEILEKQTFRSSLTTRLIAKLYSREGQIARALGEFERATALLGDCRRNDALSLLEAAKLPRNIANAYVKLAVEAAKNRDDAQSSQYLQEVPRYLALCEEAIENLGKELKGESRIEKMLLTACRARYSEASGDVKGAKKYAQEALKLARDVGAENYAVKLRMMLFHLCMALGHEEEAFVYYTSFLPLKHYATGPYQWHYRHFVGRHKAEIQKYIKDQCEAAP